MATCIHCNAEIPQGSTFCSACGKKQVVRYTHTFQKGSMSQEQFIASINQWFAQNPHVANVKGSFELEHGIGLFVNNYTLKSLAIDYELLKGNNTKQYAVCELTKTNLIKTTTDSLLKEWKEANPNASVVARNGGTNQRGKTGSLLLGGIGAVNKSQLFLLYKYPKK